MVSLSENFVVDKEGHRLGVFLDMKTYVHVIEDLEELDDIRAFDAAKAAHDTAVPFSQATDEIERKRRT